MCQRGRFFLARLCHWGRFLVAQTCQKEPSPVAHTLGDLLDIYFGKKSYATYDKSALQWNQFVHDFCADEATKGFENKLETAAALWKIVRDSDREKKYSRALLKEFRKEL